jgi:carboxypeptidase T
VTGALSRSRAFASLAALLVLVAMPPSARGANDFPANHEGYHTYAEMSQTLDDTVAAHPQIAHKVSIGQSYQGRQIWALKISDNVNTDEDEPEVLFTSQMHAREWLAQEEDLRIIDLLTSNYTTDPSTQLEQRVHDIVNGLEIWVVPMVNPDGAEYDISNPSNGFRNWRKNRQPVGGGATGIDLNRNFGFKWGCCGGSSGKPGNPFYRGSAPWQAPETAALRDFVLSRIVGGRQQIRAAIDWHAFNEQILYPFAYTKADKPLPMAADDLAAFKAVATGMANLNGYTAMQASDLYIYDGGSIDWLYGDQRIFALTIEVYPVDHSHPGFYPPDSIIQAQTTRNDGAVLYFLEHVACPYAAAGLDDTHCGPLDDDFEAARGWQVNPLGNDTATGGSWQRAIPVKSKTSAGAKQLAYGYSARYALVTGAASGASANADDLDGLTSVRSPSFDLGGPSSNGWHVQFRYTFAHGANSSSADYLRLLVNGGEVWRASGAASESNAAWQLVNVPLDAYAGQSVRLTFEACDCASDSLVEAAVDDVRVYQVP